jgi:hypothetical protein
MAAEGSSKNASLLGERGSVISPPTSVQVAPDF